MFRVNTKKQFILAETQATKSGCFYYLYEALQKATWQVYRKE